MLTLEELRSVYTAGSLATGDAATDGVLEIVEYSEQLIVATGVFDDSHVRPGGMVSGSILFRMVDAMGFLVTMARCPPRSNAFTLDVSIRFLRPAPIGQLRVEGRSLRFGKRASIVDTAIFTSTGTEPVTQAVVSYAPVFPGPTTPDRPF